MSDWQPELYLKFGRERTQPAKDLIFRIEKEDPKRIIDIGCGPGNSTAELHKRWRRAKITGLDSSETMLEKAKKDFPELDWLTADAGGDLSFLGEFDIVFSNAALQWIPDHKGLINRLFSLLSESGVLAVQIPNATCMPINLAVLETVQEERWKDRFENPAVGLYYQEPGFYFDILSPLAKEIDLWETHYYHVMSGHEAIIEWYKSTGLKPYLEKLNEVEKEEFAGSVLSKIRSTYTTQRDGRVLFPFRRLFFIAYK